MNLEELMIDDIVQFGNEQVKIVSFENCGYCNSRVFIKHKDGSIWPTHPDNIKPIPLTDEILKKNGFQYFHKNFCSLSYDHPFKLEMKQWPDENGLGGLWTVCGIIEIRFVHKLRQALQICGITKEIVL